MILLHSKSKYVYHVSANLFWSVRPTNQALIRTGTLRVRTEGDNLIFDSTLYNAVDITAVQIHLTPGKGAIDGELP